MKDETAVLLCEITYLFFILSCQTILAIYNLFAIFLYTENLEGIYIFYAISVFCEIFLQASYTIICLKCLKERSVNYHTWITYGWIPDILITACNCTLSAKLANVGTDTRYCLIGFRCGTCVSLLAMLFAVYDEQKKLLDRQANVPRVIQVAVEPRDALYRVAGGM